MYKDHICNTVLATDTLVLVEGVVFDYCGGENVEENWHLHLQQTQFAGSGYSFSASLNLQFVINSAVMPFNRVQGEEKPLTNLMIRETLGDEL